VCDLETSRMGAPYIYDISRLRVKDFCWKTLCGFCMHRKKSYTLDARQKS